MIYECARCERVSYGDGHWVELRGEGFEREDVTRVVCPDCLAPYLPPAA